MQNEFILGFYKKMHKTIPSNLAARHLFDFFGIVDKQFNFLHEIRNIHCCVNATATCSIATKFWQTSTLGLAVNAITILREIHYKSIQSSFH